MTMTITEALAEIKTINKRLEKKREFVSQFLWRQERIKDPLEKDGGSEETIKRERQAINDLEERVIKIRRAIQQANDATTVTILEVSRTVSEWLTWRREIAQNQQKFLAVLRTGIYNMRQEAQKKGLNIAQNKEAISSDNDIVVNINEQELAKNIERLEEMLGTLDGQLSLKNATVLLTGL